MIAIFEVLVHLTIGLILAPFTGGASLVGTVAAVNIASNSRRRRSARRRSRRRR